MPAKEDSQKKKRVRAVVEEVQTVQEEPEVEVKPQVEFQSQPVLETVEEPVVSIETVEPEIKESKNELEKPQQKINFKVFFSLTILIALVVGFISGGVYVYISGISSLSKPEPTLAPTATPEPTPEPTPAAMIDYKSFSVAIFNGSGKIGEAGKAEALLEDDFTIDEVGNADRFDFEETEISVKSDISDEVIEKIIDLLSSDYEVVEGDTLSSNSDFDIEITVGSLTPES